MNKRLAAALIGLVLAPVAVDADQPPGRRDVPVEATLQGSVPLRNDITRDHGGYLVEPKILGGFYTNPGENPWQIALVRSEKTGADRRPFCGGVLIAETWVLTAAHCVDNNTTPGQIDVLAGTTDVAYDGIRGKVIAILIHADYAPGDRPRDDIALLKIDRSLLGSQSQPVGLIDQNQEPQVMAPGQLARVTGWGAISENGKAVRELRYIDLKFYSNTQCNDRVAYKNDVTSHMVCAGFAKQRGDSCQGDSGGPLTVEVGGARRLAGIVSWGEGCARPGKLGVYTRVSHYADWLSKCRQGAIDCRTKLAIITPPDQASTYAAATPPKESL